MGRDEGRLVSGMRAVGGRGTGDGLLLGRERFEEAGPCGRCWEEGSGRKACIEGC